MDQPKITIFIPTYKRPQLLRRAIQSALNQTWENKQIIVCDNASKDETATVVAELKKNSPQLHYTCHPENIGMLANYHFAISVLNTDFFSFLSDDDLLLPCFCETAMKGFSQFPDLAFFAGSTIILSKERGILRIPLELWPREGRFSPEEGLPEMIGKYPVPTTVLFRKTATIDFQNQVAWDCDFLIQLAGQFPFAISKRPCGIMISHSHSFTSQQGYETTLQSIHQLIKRVKSFPWLTESLKISALHSLQGDLEKTTFLSILSNLINNRINEAKKVSYEMINPKKFNIKFFACFVMASICSIFPFIRFILVPLKKLKQITAARKFIRQGFGKYQNFMT